MALAFLELTVFSLCQHLWISWLKENAALSVESHVGLHNIRCGTVEAVIMERTIHFSCRSAMWCGSFSTERIMVRRFCAFWSLTTELYTELLCFSSNVQDSCLKFNSFQFIISFYLYFIHVLLTYFCEKNCVNNANENVNKKFVCLLVDFFSFNKNHTEMYSPPNPYSSSDSTTKCLFLTLFTPLECKCCY